MADSFQYLALFFISSGRVRVIDNWIHHRERISKASLELLWTVRFCACRCWHYANSSVAPTLIEFDFDVDKL